MKIYLFPMNHPIFEATYYILKNNYELSCKSVDFEKLSYYMRFQETAFIYKFYKQFKKYVPLPKCKYFRNTNNYDLIYSCHSVLPINKKPWVCEVECLEMNLVVAHFLKQNRLLKLVLKKLILNKYCKYILTFTEIARYAMINYLTKECNILKENVQNKIITSYPAVFKNYKIYKKQKDEKITITFLCAPAGLRFYTKGGRDALDVVQELSKKYDIKVIIKGKIPKIFNKKIEKIKHHIDIEIYEYLPSRKEIFEKIYSKTDILLHPTHSDSFGFVFLEAKSMGIPIVTTDYYSVKEVVGKGGITVPSPFNFTFNHYKLRVRDNPLPLMMKRKEFLVRDLVEACSMLIEDNKLRKEMEIYNIKEVSEGRYSIKTKEKQIKEIIENSLRF